MEEGDRRGVEGKREGERDRGMEGKKDGGLEERERERESNHHSIAQIKTEF